MEIDSVVNNIISSLHIRDAKVSRISERRGAAMFRVDGPQDAYALKFSTATSDEVQADILSVVSESEAMEQIDHLRALYEPRAGKVSVGTSLHYYVVRKWIDGTPVKRTLRSLRASGRLREVEFENIVRSAFRELSYLHSRDWSHGDLQPDHLLLTDGIVRLTDFGNAERLGMERAPYRGGLVHFNSPEVCDQILRDGHAQRSLTADVYSLGASLYYATFERLIRDYTDRGDYDQTLRDLRMGPAEYVRADLVAHLRPQTAEIFLKILSRQPAERPSSAVAVLEELDGL